MSETQDITLINQLTILSIKQLDCIRFV